MARFSSKDLEAMGIVITPDGKASMQSRRVKIVEDENEGLDVFNRRIFIAGEVRSSKNSRRLISVTTINKSSGEKKTIPKSIMSKAATDYVKKTEILYNQYAPSFQRLISNRKKPYIIEFQFVRANHQRFDFANMIQIVQDMMVEHKWIDDDNIKELLPVPNIQEPYILNPKKPGIWIKVI